MAPLKFDEHIKKQLEDREIQPSSTAWDKLADQLDEEAPKKNRGFFWYSIAASTIGILFVSFFYLNSNKDTDVLPQNPIVETTKEDVVKDPVVLQEVPNENIGNKEYREEIQKSDMQTKLVDVMEKAPSPAKKKVLEVAPNNEYTPVIQETSVAETTVGTPEDPKKSSETIFETAEKQLINDKIAAVVAQVESLENNNTQVTDAEVDKLLQQAQQELLEDRIFRSDNSVDAMALLAEAEQDLDKNFRDQLFDALKNGYQKVRTAVADRNN